MQGNAHEQSAVAILCLRNNATDIICKFHLILHHIGLHINNNTISYDTDQVTNVRVPCIIKYVAVKLIF